MRGLHEQERGLSGGGDGHRDTGDPSRRESAAVEPGVAEGSIVFLLSIAEAARALRLGRSKTYELIASGDLEVVHIGRCSRVPVDAVEAYVERLRGCGIDARWGR